MKALSLFANPGSGVGPPGCHTSLFYPASSLSSC